MLYLTELLVETLASEEARSHAIEAVTGSLRLGDTMRLYLRTALGEMSPEAIRN